MFTPHCTKRPENVSANNRTFCEKRHGKCHVSFFVLSNGHRLPRVLRFYHPVCSETPAIRLATHSSRNQRPSILYHTPVLVIHTCISSWYPAFFSDKPISFLKKNKKSSFTYQKRGSVYRIFVLFLCVNINVPFL